MRVFLLPIGRHPALILLIPRFPREVRHARLPMLFFEQAGSDRGLPEHRGARTRRGHRPSTRSAAATARAQGHRDLGRPEPAISCQDKTARAVEDLYVSLKTKRATTLAARHPTSPIVRGDRGGLL